MLTSVIVNTMILHIPDNLPVLRLYVFNSH
jgi:hypothetical protein